MRSSRITCVLAFMTAAAACGTDLVISGGPDVGAADAGPGDGARNGGDGASDASASDGSTDAFVDAAPKRRTVFVTVTKVQGDMNGVKGREGGDAICAQEAAAAGLDASVVAWLSITNYSALDRLPDDNTPWTLPSGALVFPSRWYIREGGAPKVPIVETAGGATIQGTPDAGVFTGTSSTGSDVNDDCADWTVATTAQGLAGTFGSTQYWCWGTPVLCNERHHLICFEQ